MMKMWKCSSSLPSYSLFIVIVMVTGYICNLQLVGETEVRVNSKYLIANHQSCKDLNLNCPHDLIAALM